MLPLWAAIVLALGIILQQWRVHKEARDGIPNATQLLTRLISHFPLRNLNHKGASPDHNINCLHDSRNHQTTLKVNRKHSQCRALRMTRGFPSRSLLRHSKRAQLIPSISEISSEQPTLSPWKKC
jgi:hypothetical protein